MGVRVAIVGRIGDDHAGHTVRAALQHAGVDISQVMTTTRYPTGIAVIQVDARGEKQILAVPGATSTVNRTQVERALRAFPEATVLVVQLETGLATMRHAIHAARRRNLTVIVDPSPAQRLPASLLRHIDLIKPDVNEARVLTGIAPHDRRSAARAAQRLIKLGVGAVVVQAGERGDLLVERTGRHQWLPRHSVRPVDATGAGDALVGVCAALIADHRPLAEAARWSSAAAALATTAFGAQSGLPDRATLQRFLRHSRRS